MGVKNLLVKNASFKRELLNSEFFLEDKELESYLKDVQQDLKRDFYLFDGNPTEYLPSDLKEKYTDFEKNIRYYLMSKDSLNLHTVFIKNIMSESEDEFEDFKEKFYSILEREVGLVMVQEHLNYSQKRNNADHHFQFYTTRGNIEKIKNITNRIINKEYPEFKFRKTVRDLVKLYKYDYIPKSEVDKYEVKELELIPEEKYIEELKVEKEKIPTIEEYEAIIEKDEEYQKEIEANRARINKLFDTLDVHIKSISDETKTKYEYKPIEFEAYKIDKTQLKDFDDYRYEY